MRHSATELISALSTGLLNGISAISGSSMRGSWKASAWNATSAMPLLIMSNWRGSGASDEAVNSTLTRPLVPFSTASFHGMNRPVTKPWVRGNARLKVSLVSSAAAEPICAAA